MRIVALDIGQKRVGIAVSDAECRLAFPLTTLPAAEVEACAPAFQRVLKDYEPELLLVGLPYSLSGKEGSQAHRVRQVAGRIGSACGVDVEFFDERLSSSQAKRILREQGIDEKHARGRIDEVAASLFLAAYLEGLDSREGSKAQPDRLFGERQSN